MLRIEKFNPIQDVYFQGCSRMGDNSLKSVTHPTMMKLGVVITYLKKRQIVPESRDTPPEFH